MNTENRALVVLNGDFTKTMDILRSSTYKYILAVDGAANILLDNAIKPDAIVGDMDSIRSDILVAAKEMGINVDKRDDQESTDFDKAMRHLQEKNILRIDVIGHRGFRLDHELSVYDVVVAHAPLFSIRLIDEIGDGIILHGLSDFSINNKKDHLCSLFPLNPCVNVTLRGFKWSFKRKNLEIGHFISSSNVITEDRATVSLHQGVLLVYLHHRISNH